jgi:hypothetical protein
MRAAAAKGPPFAKKVRIKLSRSRMPAALRLRGRAGAAGASGVPVGRKVASEGMFPRYGSIALP